MNNTHNPPPRRPGKRVTAIIRDDAPIVILNAPSDYRTVQFDLTDEQRETLSLHYTGQNGPHPFYETIERLILEPDAQ